MTQTNFRSKFMYNPEDWKTPKDNNTSEYSITIPFNKHCGGDSPIIQLFNKECSQDFQRFPNGAIFVNDLGDITITTPCIFTNVLKVVII